MGRPGRIDVVFLRLVNSGYGDIAKGDFERPVTFDLGTPVVSAEVAPNSTPYLGAVVSTPAATSR